MTGAVVEDVAHSFLALNHPNQAGLLPGENNLPCDHRNENNATRDPDKGNSNAHFSRVFQIIPQGD
jgi:hypothetical protein